MTDLSPMCSRRGFSGSCHRAHIHTPLSSPIGRQRQRLRSRSSRRLHAEPLTPTPRAIGPLMPAIGPPMRARLQRLVHRGLRREVNDTGQFSAADFIAFCRDHAVLASLLQNIRNFGRVHRISS